MSLLFDLGQALVFLGEILQGSRRLRIQDLSEQLWKILVSSLPTIAFSGFFVGGIMAVQFSLQLQQFDAVGYLGGLATSGTLREVGPLLIGFLLAGKVGAYTTAELGTLKITDQIDALRCLGADPLREIVCPRFVAVILASFILLVVGLMTSIFGGILVANLQVGLSAAEYVRHIPTLLHWSSIVSGLVKSFLFSLVIATICSYRGYFAAGGVRGVGLAVVQSAVECMLSLVLLDWVSSSLFDQIRRIFWG